MQVQKTSQADGSGSNADPDAVSMSDAERAALARFRTGRSLRRRVLAAPVVALSRLLVEGLNTLEQHNRASFDAAREQDRALLTFSNHTCLFDDPWLTASFSGWSWDRARWVAVDALNFFGSPLSARFFGAGKGVPIVRGGGHHQMGMRSLENRLKEGDWVHIFPEGGRSREPGVLRTPLKTGMAHLIRATRPLVLPFYHHGMENVMPIGARLPRTGNHISLRFGEVVDSNLGLADGDLDNITAWAQERLLELESQA